MELILQGILAVLAATGVICILKEGYAIMMIHCVQEENCAVLTLHGDGTSEQSQTLLLAAQQVRQLYFPGMKIIFVEQKPDAIQPTPAKQMADRWQMQYEYAGKD